MVMNDQLTIMVVRRSVGYTLLLQWFAATAAVGIMSWAISMVLAALTLGLALLIAASIVGFCIGAAQWFVLQPYIRYSDGFWERVRWVLYSTAGATIAWYLIISIRAIAASIDDMLLFHPALPIINFAIGGAVFGCLQWLVLRKKDMRSALWWVGINSVGWSIGAFVGVHLAQKALDIAAPTYVPSNIIRYTEAFQLFVGGAIAITVYSIVSGIGVIILIRLLQRNIRSDSDSSVV